MEVKSTIKYIVVVIGIVIASFLLQTVVFPHLELAGVAPNFLVIVTTSFGMMRGRRQGMLVGFSCGLLLDFFSGSVLGLYALLYLYLGYLSGFFKKIFFGDDLKLPLILIGSSDIIYGIIVYVVLFLFRKQYNIGFYLTSVILPETVYTVLVSIPIYYLILEINRWLDKDDKRSSRSLV